ncbi:hypothetical protein Q9L58_004187 [Maublancomyces gigas]|uniref:Uncharacterized protein n=1 Tax=Discina gigas TaxID=1032678 RepID=A0ABR3GLP0_9PEZI
MNTIKSFWVGWGSLIVAGGGAYYFAKIQINADRREKYLKRVAKQQYNDSLVDYDDPAGSSVRERIADQASAIHGSQAGQDESKFEASGVYRTRRGDRFS